jgi:hypothetical protein
MPKPPSCPTNRSKKKIEDGFKVSQTGAEEGLRSMHFGGFFLPYNFAIKKEERILYKPSSEE